MRRFNFALLLLLLQLFAITAVAANTGQIYWFQTGARATNQASNNSGISAYIQTVPQRDLSYGSMAFWIGENLANGAFIQEGYEINNQTGYYPTNCTLSGCSSRVFISKGSPEWFWEYFPAGYYGNKFLGEIGPNDSAGPYGAYNNYTFYYNGSRWIFLFNGMHIGSINLNTSSSGPNPPTAFGEYAGAINNITNMSPVTFRNFSYFRSGNLIEIPKAYAYVGYGKGSAMQLANPYRIMEIEPYANLFEVGSYINESGPILWNQSGKLNIISEFGNTSFTKLYNLYSSFNFSEPRFYYINSTARAVFEGWKGSGFGSYTGNSTNLSLVITSNITEKAIWGIQYYINASSEYGNATGSGWYYNGSYAKISVPNQYNFENGTIFKFRSWNGKYSNSSISFRVNAPATFVANFSKIYEVHLIALDGYNQTINASWFEISGTKYNSTANLTGSVYFVQYAVYKNAEIGIDRYINVTGPSTFKFELPVYNISIYIRNYFGSPVSGTAKLVFSNGTSQIVAINSSGVIALKKVPFGFVKVTVQHGGMKLSFNDSSGTNLYISVPDLSLYFAIIIGGLIVVLAFFAGRRFFEK
ncbi:MAG: hypothetical protein QXN59_00090 [Candidatus Micrarchaeaceae archaeon]